MVLILFLGVVLYVAYRATTAEERARVARAVLEAIREARRAAARREANEPFRAALVARTRRAPVTPALVALNAVIFLFMLVGAGSLGDPDTFVRWGGNFGPRTTNGEWWRLVATAFIHSGMLSLLVNIAGMFQLGLVLERLVGPVAFAVTYVAAAVCASLVSLSLHPDTVNAGASAAIFGIYGLLLASSIWSIRHRSTVTIPLQTLKRVAPAAAVFILYNLGTAGSERALQLAGLLTGVVCGGVLMKNIGDRKPPAPVVAAAALAIVVAAVACAVPLRGMACVKPEIERLASLEDRAVSAYQAEVERFKDGRINAARLAGVIDRTITPDVQAARARLKTLKNVPHDQQPLVNAADEYLRLRDESWRLRSEALHKSSMPTLRKADETERASLEAFHTIKAAQGKGQP
jgi:membrane associated rhomboid family serine protease